MRRMACGPSKKDCCPRQNPPPEASSTSFIFSLMRQHLCCWQGPGGADNSAEAHARKRPSLGAQQGLPQEAHHSLLVCNQRLETAQALAACRITEIYTDLQRDWSAERQHMQECDMRAVPKRGRSWRPAETKVAATQLQ